MDTVYRVFRRFLLVLLGVAIIGLVDDYGHGNWALTLVAAIVVFLPVGVWLVRPKELEGDSLEESLTYSLIPSLTAVPLALVAVSYLFQGYPAQYGMASLALILAVVMLAHGLQRVLRTSWVRQGFRPRWASGLVFFLVTVVGLLAAAVSRNAGQASQGFDKGLSGSSSDDDSVYNPATGLRMLGGIGGFDSEGNGWGQSSSTASDGFDSEDQM